MRPTRIPLFPLDVVLLPGMPLPLHIFEPRYKVMIARCLNEKLEFGMVLAAEKRVAAVGCTAEIVQKIKDYPDGRMDILTEGRALFQLTQVLEEKEYYEGLVEYLPEDSAPQDPRKETRLVEIFQQCHRLLFGQPWLAPRGDGGVPLTYRMAARLPLELEKKQTLLETRSEDERRDFLIRWMNELLPQLIQRQRLRQQTGGNGRGRK